MRRRVSAISGLAATMTIAAIVGIGAGRAAGTDTGSRPAPVRAVAAHVVRAARGGRPACTTPAPTTAAGYTRAFASLPASQWGAADVALSVPLPDGRIVWLWGDTLRAGPMVHSSAIVQTRGCLHVSRAGAQLLPNTSPTLIYWITGARTVGPGRLRVAARQIRLTGHCAWCFADNGLTRYATVTIDQDGDATFRGWSAVETHERLDPGPMIVYGPHHIGYQRRVHPEITLADGRHLVTTCQNWDDGRTHRLADYRPILAEESSDA